jgi:lambda family phage portal protein
MRCIAGYDRKTRRPIYDEVDNATIERAFADWSKPENCTVRGNMSRAKAEQLAETTMAIDGECFIRLVEEYDNPHGFAWQFIETDRIDETHNETLPSGNRVVMGIELNGWGKAVAYHIWKRDPNDYLNTSGMQSRRERERIPAKDIIHRFNAIFPEQVRGIPEMYASILRLNHLGAYEEAEVIAARIGAGKLGFITEPEGGDFTGADGEMADGTPVIDTEPGTFTTLPHGSEVKSYDPQHPNASFESFVRAMLRGVACTADMSYHSLTGDLTAVNYSSARIGLLDERDGYIDRQQAAIDHLCGPSFSRWLTQAMLSGKLALPFSKFDKFNSPEWKPRRWPGVDPLKDMQAAVLAVEKGFTSRRAVIAENGGDIEDVFADQEADEILAEEHDLDFADDSGEQANAQQETPDEPDDVDKSKKGKA